MVSMSMIFEFPCIFVPSPYLNYFCFALTRVAQALVHHSPLSATALILNTNHSQIHIIMILTNILFLGLLAFTHNSCYASQITPQGKPLCFFLIWKWF